MDEGLDLKIWLTLIGVFVVFFAVPFFVLERDRRRRDHEHAD
jgi:preprotein translocase subunit YajC